jgi:myo-inositol-1(or 4)-monophosphatase
MSLINDYAKVCEEAARAGGAVVTDWIGRIAVRKKGHADLVTQADLASQEAVRRIVLGAFPHHSLLGEEDAPAPPPEKRAEYRWIVDPLDGTTNYVHQVPHYAVSLALEHNGNVLVGTVYDPSTNECYTAAAGQGARLNGRPITTSPVTELSEALAVTGFPNKVLPDSPDLLVFLKAVLDCQSVRRTGCASLNLCYLAAGRLDVCWNYSTKIWDVAAGALIIREAGGIVTATNGGEFVLEDAHLLASANPTLHAQLVQMALAATEKA